MQIRGTCAIFENRAADARLASHARTAADAQREEKSATGALGHGHFDVGTKMTDKREAERAVCGWEIVRRLFRRRAQISKLVGGAADREMSRILERFSGAWIRDGVSQHARVYASLRSRVDEKPLDSHRKCAMKSSSYFRLPSISPI